MSKIGAFLLKEFKSLLPVTIYFICANELLALTQLVLLKEHGISVESFFRAIVIALVVAKVVAVVDHLPVTKMLRKRPVLPRAIFMAFVYGIASVAVQMLEGIAHHLMHENTAAGSPIQQFVADTVWIHFWMVQVWLLVLFINFCIVREIGVDLGKGKLRKILLSRE